MLTEDGNALRRVARIWLVIGAEIFSPNRLLLPCGEDIVFFIIRKEVD
jgi:hypothetical protein